jgi:hypothetical protein
MEIGKWEMENSTIWPSLVGPNPITCIDNTLSIRFS